MKQSDEQFVERLRKILDQGNLYVEKTEVVLSKEEEKLLQHRLEDLPEAVRAYFPPHQLRLLAQEAPELLPYLRGEVFLHLKRVLKKEQEDHHPTNHRVSHLAPDSVLESQDDDLADLQPEEIQTEPYRATTTEEAMALLTPKMADEQLATALRDLFNQAPAYQPTLREIRPDPPKDEDALSEDSLDRRTQERKQKEDEAFAAEWDCFLEQREREAAHLVAEEQPVQGKQPLNPADETPPSFAVPPLSSPTVAANQGDRPEGVSSPGNPPTKMTAVAFEQMEPQEQAEYLAATLKRLLGGTETAEEVSTENVSAPKRKESTAQIEGDHTQSAADSARPARHGEEAQVEPTLVLHPEINEKAPEKKERREKKERDLRRKSQSHPTTSDQSQTIWERFKMKEALIRLSPHVRAQQEARKSLRTAGGRLYLGAFLPVLVLEILHFLLLKGRELSPMNFILAYGGAQLLLLTAALLLPIIFVLQRYALDASFVMGKYQPSPAVVVMTSLLGVPIFLAISSLNNLVSYVLLSLHYHTPPTLWEKGMYLLRLFPDWSSYAILLPLVLILEPLLEEIFFRGLLLGFFLKNTKPQTAILVAGVAYALYKPVSFSWIAPLLMAWALGYLRWKTGSLWPVLGARWVYALASFLVQRFVPQWVSDLVLVGTKAGQNIVQASVLTLLISFLLFLPALRQLEHFTPQEQAQGAERAQDQMGDGLAGADLRFILTCIAFFVTKMIFL